MPARVEIQIRKIGGPGFYILVKSTKQGDVVRVVPTHLRPALSIPPHTTEPEMLTRVWEFPPEAQKATGRIKLIRIELEVFPEDLESIDRPKRGRRFKLMIDKPGVGLLDVEGIAVMRDDNIRTAQELVKLFNEEVVVLEMFFIAWKIWQRADGYLVVAASPSIGEAQHVPVF